MAKHIKTGEAGEALAVDYLTGKGFVILHKNWRYRHWEIDIIALKEGVLHFIEVKTRTTDFRGFPEESVTKSKIQYLISAGEEYLFQNPKWQRVLYDVLAITLKPKLTFFWIEDVFL